MVGETVKFKMGDLNQIFNAIGKLAKQPLQMKAAYWLKRNYESIVASCKELDKARNDLILEYGIPEDKHIEQLLSELPDTLTEEETAQQDLMKKRLEELKAGNYQSQFFIPEDNQEFKKKLNDILETEVEVTVNKIEIEDMMNAKITMGELHFIAFMLTEKSLIQVSRTHLQ
jgi:hypothetical protein